MLRVASITLLLLLFGCQQGATGPQSNETPVVETSQPESSEVSTVTATLPFTGTVKYFDLEGGFFGIVTSKGQKLLPMNLDKKYLQNGTVIEFSGDYKEGMMTIQMWGKPFELKEVKLIKKGKEVRDSDL
ncbi:hypothetical protein [Aliikangiella coralliicola]|uniref:Uncharacterized protein n=1 Tax=Aliikangiella coralliicola TaxID=2592383 RepID=A0A545UBT7_9GAMM|nr:hypothetical protein [Aliikangiella coralliicola]TQV86928.1 hypothetical protein FLL46_14025 [Aliikangiella coralliicola]